MALDPASLADRVGAEIEAIAAVVEANDPALPVPSCPGWDLTDLADHIGAIHRWVTHMVSVRSPERLPRDPERRPRDAAANAAWLRAGRQPLLDAFAGVDPETPMWAWGLPKSARFWPRRMLHETGIHRADAELAVGATPAFEPEVVIDGIAELLANLPEAAYFAPGVAALRGDGGVLRFRAADAPVAVSVELHPGGFAWTATNDETTAPPAADVTVTAPASDLLLLVYGRRRPDDPGIAVTGDRALLDRWLRDSAI